MTRNELIDEIATAISKVEYWYKGSNTWNYCNPGALREWHDLPVANGLVQFPTPDDGWRALRQQIETNIFKYKLTLREFFAGKPHVYSGFAPSIDGDRPTSYANSVAKAIGAVSIDIPLKDMIDD